jgi:predicted neutral ceramidase superfamily lipid hydrolase
VQTISLVILMWQIRNVKDELNLKKELYIVIAIWIVFSLFYFAALQIDMNSSKDQDKFESQMIFAFIQVRNLLSFSVQTYFCHQTIKNSVVSQYATNSPEFPTQLYDFELAILGSVLPYLYFKRFVLDDRVRRAQYKGHLDIVTEYQ